MKLLFPVMLLAQRRRQPEWMDQPELDRSLHEQALAGLARINRWSASSRIFWGPLRRLAREQPWPVRVLDVACGGGDVTVQLARRALRSGVDIQFTGCDRSALAVACAQRRAARAGVKVEFVQQDVVSEPIPPGFDAVISSLFLHHLAEREAIEVLRAAAAAVRRLVLVNDLVRSVLAWYLAWAATRLLTRSPVVHLDGPLSVEGAFTPEEALELARAASIDGATVARRWPCRFLLEYWKPSPLSAPTSRE